MNMEYTKVFRFISWLFKEIIRLGKRELSPNSMPFRKRFRKPSVITSTPAVESSINQRRKMGKRKIDWTRNVRYETTSQYRVNCTVAIGIDPGIANTAYGVVAKTPTAYRTTDNGVIQTPPNWDEATRLAYIYDELTERIKEHQPDILCIESVFFQKNRKTAMSTAKVIGMCLSLGKQNHIQLIKEVKPQDIKAALTSSRTASKEQMKKMAEKVTQLPKGTLKTHHEADAIGAAVMGHMLNFPRG